MNRPKMMLEWRWMRWGAASLFLGVVIVLAWMLNREVDVWFIRIGQYLAKYEVLHILMHIFIFGCVTLFLRSAEMTRRQQWLMVGIVFVGAGGIEVAQIFAGDFAVNAEIIWGALFDLLVDGIGVMLGLMIREWIIMKSEVISTQ